MLHPSLQSSLVSVLSTLCLSLTPISCFRLFPVIDLIMLYSSLLLPFSAAFSAAATLFSYQFLLFPVVLHFTTLFFALYSSLRLYFSRSDLAPSNFNFASFLSVIFCFLSMAYYVSLTSPRLSLVHLCMLPKSCRILPSDHQCLLTL